MTLEYVPKRAALKYVQVLFWSDMTEIKLRKAFLLSSGSKKIKGANRASILGGLSFQLYLQEQWRAHD